MVTASRDHVSLWNVTTAELLRSPLERHTRSIRRIKITPDGSRILIASGEGDISHSENNIVEVCDVQSGQVAHTFEDHYGLISALDISQDGSTFASVSENIVSICSLSTYSLLAEILAHGDGSEAGSTIKICFSPSGTKLLVGSKKVAMVQRLLGEEPSLKVNLQSDIVCLQYAPDGGSFMTGSKDGKVCIWDAVAQGDLLLCLQHDTPVYTASFSPEGLRIASASQGGYIRIWDALSGDLQVGEPIKIYEDKLPDKVEKVAPEGRSSEDSFLNRPAVLRRQQHGNDKKQVRSGISAGDTYAHYATPQIVASIPRQRGIFSYFRNVAQSQSSAPSQDRPRASHTRLKIISLAKEKQSHVKAKKTLENRGAKKKLKMWTDVFPHVISTPETYQMTFVDVADTYYGANRLSYTSSELHFDVNPVSNIA
ncbi:WD40 repeat-like protein [Coniophora puteana RWD-64-598 SS2]|uniref:WD40 repeat-like protein n=1 Tax=Coniophora puteana (strain RWD-64-598) TaxID=741705 RepID=A0A5M3N350_CONPW|nr:WD40 repeat-like protein [Coniophora puteana RWD-64-598 SS2]EIW85829.1 WD40 repeat-like protein [Coniophora puteana RWD-64-598 SS2]